MPTKTTQKADVVTDVDVDTQADINKIADDAILDAVKRDCKKLPKDYTINGWNIVGRVD